MIDFLSNPHWINPQIDFLLFLQNIRLEFPEIIDKFFLSITIFGEFWLPTLICAVTYWCIDSKAGVYLFTLEGFNILITHFFKMLACVYRPWVLNESLRPSELAVPFAKGYSFPSGHSAMTASVVGGVAYLVKNKKALCISLIGLILLVGFSRLWLGVHTPQDVVCGLLTGLILIFAVFPIINKAEKNKNLYLYMLVIVNILAVLALIYMKFYNSYRIDYIGNEMLVEPQKSIYVTFSVYGYALGLLNGCFLCRRFFPFDPKNAPMKNRITRGIIGSVMLILLMKFVLEYFVMNIVAIRYSMMSMFILGLIVTLIYPIIFTKIFSKNI